MERVNIIIWENGGGLSTHRRILLEVLGDAGFRVTVNGHPPVPALGRRFRTRFIEVLREACG